MVEVGPAPQAQPFLPSKEATNVIHDNPGNPARFRPYARRLVVLLVVLLYVYVSFLALRITGYLDRRTFDIDKVGPVSTLIIVTSQTFAILITSAIVFLGQSLGFQYLIYRDRPVQTLISLHYGVSSFNGAISASSAMWETRRLRGVHHGYLFQTLLYAVAVFVLQQATTTMISVDTVMLNTTISVDVTKLFDDGSAATFDFDQPSAKESLGGLPFIRGDISVGLQLPGLNGSVFFSYPTKISDTNDVYLDHDARQLTTHCESFPYTNVNLSIGYINLGPATPIQQSEILAFLVDAAIGSLYPNVTYTFPRFVDAYSMNPPRRQFGGAKPTRTSPPVMNFQGVLPLRESDEPFLNRNTSAFLYLNSDPNALQIDPSLNISSPGHREKQISVWSWLPEDVANITSLSQEIPNAFEELANMSLNIWPMVCTLSVLNVTAQVNGNGELLQYWVDEVHGTSQGDNPLVGAAFSTNWAIMLNTIASAELWVHFPGRIRAFWLEDQIVSALNTSLSGAPNTTVGAINTLETRLGSLGALAYALFSRTPAYESILNVTSARIDPRLKTVPGVRTILRARLSINAPQLYVALASAFGMAVFLGTLINNCRLQLRDPVQDGSGEDKIDMTGASAFDMIALMDELPALFESHEEELKERTKDIKVQMEYKTTADSQTPQVHSMHLTGTVVPLPQRTLDWISCGCFSQIGHILKSMWPTASKTPSESKLPPGFFSTLIALVLLVSLHAVLAVLYARRFFDERVFSLSRIRFISQAVALGLQLVCSALLVPFQSVLQKVACNIYIHIRREDSPPTLADLSDMLLAWSGPGAAVVASLRNFSSRRGINVRLSMVTIFNVAIMVLNVSIPALLSVSTVSVNRRTTTFAQPMPGDFSTSSSWTASGDVDSIVAALPQMARYFNGTVGTVRGWNGTYASQRDIFLMLGTMLTGATDIRPISLTIPANNSALNTFRDEYASELAVKCRYLQPPEVNTTFQVINSDSALSVFANIELALPPNITETFNLTTAPNSPMYNYTFGGSKPSKDSPPNIHFPDMVMFDAGAGSSCDVDCMSFGNVAVGYLTLRPNGLAPPAGVDFPSPMKSVVSASVLSWIGNATEEKFNETIDITFYLYPLICSPYVLNTTAHILGNGTMLSYELPPQPPRSQTPFQRGIPTTTVERNWPLIVASLTSNPLFMSTNVVQWFQDTWQAIVSQDATTEAIERELASITSMVYAIAVLDWKMQLDDGNPLVLNYWRPSNVTLEGYVPEIVGRLDVNLSMLIVGCACSGVLIFVAGVHMIGLRGTYRVTHDGSTLDLVSILRGSDLPSWMDEPGMSKRQQATAIRVT